MTDALGGRLHHLHLTDGTAGPKDDHLVPGRGTQPCAEVLDRLVANGFSGMVTVEVSTRGATDADRETDLALSLAFARLYLDPTGG